MSLVSLRLIWPHALRTHPVPLRVRLARRQWAAGDARRDAGLTPPEDVVRFTDLSYGKWGNWNLLDLYRPAAVPSPLPVIVSVHGGGYFYGSKEVYQYYCMDLARRGFGVVNFNYRLAPEFRFPAPLEDLNQLLRWLLHQGAAYQLDLRHLFLVGDSAGAQIASQYAAAWSNPDYAALLGLEIPPVRISGLGLNCGLYHIDRRAKDGSLSPLARDYLGPDFDLSDPRLDVMGHLTGGYPPAYLISAPNDFLASQCQPMAARLKGLGVLARWKLYGTLAQREVGHVFHVNLRLPEAQLANDEETAFFRSLIH